MKMQHPAAQQFCGPLCSRLSRLIFSDITPIWFPGYSALSLTRHHAHLITRILVEQRRQPGPQAEGHLLRHGRLIAHCGQNLARQCDGMPGMVVPTVMHCAARVAHSAAAGKNSPVGCPHAQAEVMQTRQSAERHHATLLGDLHQAGGPKDFSTE